MDKSQAIHNFWSGFGLTAYDQFAVPEDAKMPYITYSVSTGAIDNILSVTGSLWYRSTSWREISQKADEIAAEVGGWSERRIYKIDNGYMFINQGSPFAQRMSDPADDMIRRIYINLSVEFLTPD